MEQGTTAKMDQMLFQYNQENAVTQYSFLRQNTCNQNFA